METKQYAPVLIPTLNRFDHFKRCIESLEKCTGADKTEVFVALDYPPSEKYVEGWKKIDEYLRFKELQNAFKGLHVVRRNRNYGVCHEDDNLETLLRDVEKDFDRHIDSEDDNEFSPNFLEYINKGLEKYKDDDRIMMISGYSYPDIATMDFASNVVAFKKAACWGAGYWFDKPFTYTKMGAEKYRDSILCSWKKSIKLFFLRPISLNSLMSMKFRNRVYGDGLMIDCLQLENKYCVFPKVSKVRNWGNDGSGVHCGIESHYESQKIDQEMTFEYDPLLFIEKTPRGRWSKYILVDVLYKVSSPIIIAFRYIYFRLTNKDCFSFYFERGGKV